jgi:phage baseplate assembly protein W
MSYDLGQRVLCNHLDRYGNDYKSNPGACPKCLGLGYYYDMLWDNVTGNISKVEDLHLLQELCLKSILTEVGDNPFHPEFGTHITRAVASPTSESTKRVVEKEVGVAMAGLKGRQDLQAAIGQSLSKDERIYQLKKIDVSLSASDSRNLKVNIYIVTESGKDLVYYIER